MPFTLGGIRISPAGHLKKLTFKELLIYRLAAKVFEHINRTPNM